MRGPEAGKLTAVSYDGIEEVAPLIGFAGLTLAGIAALFIGLTGLARTTKARLLAGAHVVVVAAFWINLADWFKSGCSDTPGCGWEAGFTILPLTWVAVALATIAYWISRRGGSSP